jgi:O-antigen/teichoic acid export membrane protein
LNNRVSVFIKNFSYALASNLISLVISTLVILVVPKVIGLEDYGYWQLYLFYVSYVGFLHFGWNDGIYLRYGGERYESLDKKLFFSQYSMLAIFQLFLSMIVIILTTIFEGNPDMGFIYQMIGINIFLMNIKNLFLYILQSTNRIKEYSFVTIIDRLLYAFLILIFLFVGVNNYQFMIWADVIGKLIAMLISMHYCNEIVRQKWSSFSLNLTETKRNISTGIKLMFANIASQLVIGIVRFGIERSWDVATFGKVSLTLSISNMLMIFINALGIIMFPILRRTDEKRLSELYGTLRNFTMVILFALMVLYFPIRLILSNWLPQYANSLQYLAFLFPMVIFEGKASILINTYLKTLRQEKIMLKMNFITVLLSVVLTVLSTIILNNLDLAILSILLLLGFRCSITEVYLVKLLDISVVKDMALEWGLSVIFISLGWFFYSWLAVIVYLIFYLIYLFIKRKDVTQSFNEIKNMIKS